LAKDQERPLAHVGFSQWTRRGAGRGFGEGLLTVTQTVFRKSLMSRVVPMKNAKTYHTRWRMPSLSLLLWSALIGGAVAQHLLSGFPATEPKSVSVAHPEPISLGETATVFQLCSRVAQQNCVIDGDTIRYGGMKIRLEDIDAPEIHDFKCASERGLGERAKLRLLDLINSGPFEVVRMGDRDTDTYGRKLRTIRRDSRSLGDILVTEGLASPWEGHHHYWCR
jgi:endonuclease YncB( thermonuclease family)